MRLKKLTYKTKNGLFAIKHEYLRMILKYILSVSDKAKTQKEALVNIGFTNNQAYNMLSGKQITLVKVMYTLEDHYKVDIEEIMVLNGL